MQRYFNSVANQRGAAIAGASVLVQNSDLTTATVYSTNSAAVGNIKTNPLTSDSLGEFFFYAADGRYNLIVVPPRGSTSTLSDVLIEDPAEGSVPVASTSTWALGAAAASTATWAIGGGTSSYAGTSGVAGTSAVALIASTATYASSAGTSVYSGTSAFSTSALAASTATVAPNYLSLSTASSTAGSSLIGFLQAGTSAVARTVQDKERDVLSVFDFMTPAQIADVKARTRTEDCTAAIQAAINATTGTLFFPAGDYVVSTSLDLTGKLGLFIMGSGNYGQSDAAIVGRAVIGNYPVLDFSQSNQCSIKNISVRSYTAENCFIGILLARVGSNSSQGHVLEDVAVYGNFTHTCLYMSSSEEVNIIRGSYESLSAGARSTTLIDVPESGVTSAYKDITAPTGGNTVTRFVGGRFLNLTGNASNRSFFIDTARHVQLHGLYINAGTAATHAIEVTASSLVSFHSVTWEGTPTNAVSFNGTNSNIELRSCVFPVCTGVAVEGASGSVLTGLVIDTNNVFNAAPAISLDSVNSSRIALGPNQTGTAITSIANFYSRVASTTALTLSSSTSDFISYDSAVLPIFVNRAWGSFTVATGGIVSTAGGNISAINYSGTGSYGVVFSTSMAMPDANYAINLAGQRSSAGAVLDYTVASKSTAGFTIRNINAGGTAEDCAEVSFMVTR